MRSPGFSFTSFLHSCILGPVDPKSIVREISRKTPAPPRYRAAKGAWIKPAWAVRRMVEKGNWMVSDAVREVVTSMQLHPPDVAFAGVRAAYYEVKKRDWKNEPE